MENKVSLVSHLNRAFDAGDERIPEEGQQGADVVRLANGGSRAEEADTVSQVELDMKEQEEDEEVEGRRRKVGEYRRNMVGTVPEVYLDPTGTTDKKAPAFRDSAQVRTSGFVIRWRDLNYVVESKWWQLSSHRKCILNSTSGSVRSGELTAILGPSGAGKSTLIDCLLGKHKRGLTGQTRVEFSDELRAVDEEGDPEVSWPSHSSTQTTTKRRPLKIALIPQKDHLLDSLTVTETFMFASRIKNAHLSWEDEEQSQPEASEERARRKRRPFDHLANVQRVLEQLNLSSCGQLRCGQLSGGQYKRVSIGQELLSRPDLLVLDEPTSGLDSLTCLQTVRALRRLIDSSSYPMAIVATIHQPDSEVFSLFHKAYVLASGGRPLYEGPTDTIPAKLSAGLELVRRRRRELSLWGVSQPASTDQHGQLLDELERRLEPHHPDSHLADRNPARLAVEVAAGVYGLEIVGALHELHLSGHRARTASGSGSAGASWASVSTPSGSEGSRASSPSTAPADTQSAVRICLGGSSPATSVSDGVASTRAYPLPAAAKFDYARHAGARSRRPDLDKTLQLSEANLNRKRGIRVYLRHLKLHTCRSWTTIVRDPMLFTVQVILHVLVPLLISYSFQGSQHDACPSVGQLDVIHEVYRPGNVLEELNLELRSAFDNLGYIFFQIYVIIFAAVCVTSLTYPLAMHVLLKEYRNGWYSLSSYFLGRTLADLPVPSFNVVLAMAISYHLTGQPMSYFAWRFASVAGLTVLATLVAQTQGLIFGALLMNLPQSAVFVAPASTAPLVVVSGFLFRIKTMPVLLQMLSRLSYFTYLLDGIIVSRYGFNRCPCEPTDFQASRTHEIPYQVRTFTDIWVQSYQNEYPQVNAERLDLLGKLVDTVTRAKMFGYNMTDCSEVKPFTMLDYNLNDSDLAISFIALGLMLVGFRWATYGVLSWKIRSSI